MVESGEVVKTEKNYAVVRIDRKNECSKCGMCGMKAGMNSIDCKAKNEMNASVGDTVLISTEKNASLLSSLLIFLLPLVLIAGEIAVCYVLKAEELWILLICVGTLALWFVLLALIDKKLAKIRGFCPTVIKIIEKEGGEKNE